MRKLTNKKLIDWHKKRNKNNKRNKKFKIINYPKLKRGSALLRKKCAKLKKENFIENQKNKRNFNKNNKIIMKIYNNQKMKIIKKKELKYLLWENNMKRNFKIIYQKKK